MAILGLSDLVEAMRTGTRDDFERQMRATSNLPATSNFNLDVSESEWRDLTTASSQALDSSVALDFDQRTISDVTDVNMRRRTTEKDPSQELRSLLYHIAEEDAKRQSYVHRGVHCEECSSVIRGVRWHCLQCLDFDLCSLCEASTRHTPSHVFAKIKIPIPWLYNKLDRSFENWYPGPNLGSAGETYMGVGTAESLANKHSFSQPQIEALFEQFSCLVNVEWEDDLERINWAFDRRAFNAALSHQRWRSQTAASLLYDRMFDFYDTDKNGLLGFEEFVSGIAYLRGVERKGSLARAIRGYDLDDDGFIDRNDMLRIMEASFVISREITNDLVEAQTLAQISDHDAIESLRGRQPISSILQDGDIDERAERIVEGKTIDAFGDKQPDPCTATIIAAEEMWPTEFTPRPLEPGSSEEYLAYRAYLDMLTGRPSETESESNESKDSSSPSKTEDALSPTESKDNASAAKLEDDSPSLNLKPDSTPASVLAKQSESGHRGILWKLVVNSINELLDDIFKEHEDEEKAAIATAQLRHERRRDIQQYIEAEQRTGDVASSKKDIDMMTDDSAFQTSELQPCTYITGTFNGEPMESVSAVAYEAQDAVSKPVEESEPEPESSTYSLERLVALEKAAQKMTSRGGPGRLSYAEVESAADTRDHIRALVRTWLDYASF
jgi:Ca2+-binding EF-hand superfamily protein